MVPEVMLLTNGAQGLPDAATDPKEDSEQEEPAEQDSDEEEQASDLLGWRP